MRHQSQSARRVPKGIAFIGVAACLVAAGCSDIRPEPNMEESGVVQSPTQEQDGFHEAEDREEHEGQ
jgi:hypothetical protein